MSRVFPTLNLLDTAFHKGKDGANQIDQKAVSTVGRAMYDFMDQGAVRCVGLEKHEITHEGSKRRVRVVQDFELPD